MNYLHVNVNLKRNGIRYTCFNSFPYGDEQSCVNESLMNIINDGFSLEDVVSIESYKKVV